MSSYAKEKGKKFETKIAKQIHKHLLENCDKYKSLVEAVNNDNVHPKRDSSSGVFTSANGDIELGIAKEFFPFSVECKDHKDLDLGINSIFKGKIKKLYKIWHEQTVPNAIRAELEPLAVFKANRTQTFVVHNKGVVNEEKYSIFVKLKDGLIMALFDEFMDLYE